MRGKLQKHLDSPYQYLQGDNKVILSVPLYVNFYRQYDHLKELILKLTKDIEQAGKDVSLISSASDLDQSFKLGIILHIESARPIKNFNEQLPALFDLGVRGIIPLHFIDNHLGNSCDDPFRRLCLKNKDEGLTKQGEQFVKLCNKLGMWLDLTHTTDRTGDDILTLANNVMTSHVGIRELRPLKRNKSIQFLTKIAQKNGLIGLTPWVHLIGTDVNSYKSHYVYACENGLGNHISIGSDFGAPIKTHRKLRSIYDISNLIPDKNFLYENAYNFFKRNLPS